MSNHLKSQALAFVAGLVFLAGTCGILFEDYFLHSAPLALKHLVTGVILAGTIMTGHLAHDALRAKRRLSMAGFGLVFAFGTCLVVYNSTGRQAGETIQTSAQIDETNSRRAGILAARVRDQKRFDVASDEVKTACKGGDGKNCKGAKATMEVYRAALKGHDADLDKLGPTRVTAPEAEQFADVLSVVFEFDKAKVKAAAVLLQPFLVTLFLEFGTIVSFGYAFRSRQSVAVKVSEPANDVAPPPLPRKRLPSVSTVSVIDFQKHKVLKALEREKAPVTNARLAELLGETPGEASKSWREVADHLEIGKSGKELRIALKRYG